MGREYPEVAAGAVEKTFWWDPSRGIILKIEESSPTGPTATLTLQDLSPTG